MSVQLNPLNSDWNLSNRSYYSVMTSLSAALKNILRFILCNCNSSKKDPRITSTCSCRKHGFPCISVCSDCNGANCTNYENEIDMDGGSDEKQDRNILDVIHQKQLPILSFALITFKHGLKAVTWVTATRGPRGPWPLHCFS